MENKMEKQGGGEIVLSTPGYSPNSYKMMLKWYPPQINSRLGLMNPGLIWVGQVLFYFGVTIGGFDWWSPSMGSNFMVAATIGSETPPNMDGIAEPVMEWQSKITDINGRCSIAMFASWRVWEKEQDHEWIVMVCFQKCISYNPSWCRDGHLLIWISIPNISKSFWWCSSNMSFWQVWPRNSYLGSENFRIWAASVGHSWPSQTIRWKNLFRHTSTCEEHNTDTFLLKYLVPRKFRVNQYLSQPIIEMALHQVQVLK